MSQAVKNRHGGQVAVPIPHLFRIPHAEQADIIVAGHGRTEADDARRLLIVPIAVIGLACAQQPGYRKAEYALAQRVGISADDGKIAMDTDDADFAASIRFVIICRIFAWINGSQINRASAIKAFAKFSPPCRAFSSFSSDPLQKKQAFAPISSEHIGDFRNSRADERFQLFVCKPVALKKLIVQISLRLQLLRHALVTLKQ